MKKLIFILIIFFNSFYLFADTKLNQQLKLLEELYKEQLISLEDYEKAKKIYTNKIKQNSSTNKSNEIEIKNIFNSTHEVKWDWVGVFNKPRSNLMFNLSKGEQVIVLERVNTNNDRIFKIETEKGTIGYIHSDSLKKINVSEQASTETKSNKIEVSDTISENLCHLDGHQFYIETGTTKSIVCKSSNQEKKYKTETDYVEQDVEKVENNLAISNKSNEIITDNGALSKFKKLCSSMGFQLKSNKFNDCVLKLYQKDKQDKEFQRAENEKNYLIQKEQEAIQRQQNLEEARVRAEMKKANEMERERKRKAWNDFYDALYPQKNTTIVVPQQKQYQCIDWGVYGGGVRCF